MRAPLTAEVLLVRAAILYGPVLATLGLSIWRRPGRRWAAALGRAPEHHHLGWAPAG